MSPTHANKKGLRYRYYTSHALLQRRKEHAGSVPRVSAPEVEALVCEAVRREVSAAEELSDKDFITHYVSKVSIRGDRIEVGCERAPDEEEFDSRSKLTIAFTPTMALQKGITRQPAENGQIDAVAREKLLKAIRRAGKWVEAVRSGEAESFADIAAQEGLGERHVPWLAPLAFLSPRVLTAILNGSAPAGLTLATLLNALSPSWGAADP